MKSKILQSLMKFVMKSKIIESLLKFVMKSKIIESLLKFPGQGKKENILWMSALDRRWNSSCVFRMDGFHRVLGFTKNKKGIRPYSTKAEMEKSADPGKTGESQMSSAKGLFLWLAIMCQTFVTTVIVLLFFFWNIHGPVRLSFVFDWVPVPVFF